MTTVSLKEAVIISQSKSALIRSFTNSLHRLWTSSVPTLVTPIDNLVSLNLHFVIVGTLDLNLATTKRLSAENYNYVERNQWLCNIGHAKRSTSITGN